MQQIYILLCGFQSTNSDRFSGDGYEDPPVPISNTVVKLINAESTWLETAWEDRKLLINEKKKVYRMVGLFLFAHLRLAPPARTVSSQGCRGYIYLRVCVRRPWEKQGSRRWRSETTTDSLHRFFPNVRFTELRSREGKSTVRIDRKPRLMVVSN